MKGNWDEEGMEDWDKVSKRKLGEGDLVLLDKGRKKGIGSDVGIYLKDNKLMDGSRRGGVIMRRVNEDY